MSSLRDKARHAKNVASLLSARVELRRTGADQERIAQITQQRIRSAISFASNKSPFYRDFYRGVKPDAPLRLQDLPILSKATMMDNLNRVFTDPRLDLAGINRHVAAGRASERYLGQYRVIATSGSTGSDLRRSLCVAS